MARTELRDAAAVSIVGSDDQGQAAGTAVDHDQFVELTVYAAPVVQRAFVQGLEAISAFCVIPTVEFSGLSRCPGFLTPPWRNSDPTNQHYCVRQRALTSRWTSSNRSFG